MQSASLRLSAGLVSRDRCTTMEVAIYSLCFLETLLSPIVFPFYSSINHTMPFAIVSHTPRHFFHVCFILS